MALVMDIALYTVLPGAHARIRVVDQVDQESDVSQFLFYNIDFQGAKTLLSFNLTSNYKRPSKSS